MEILTASRERKTHLNQVTTITDNNGKVVKIITGYKQPIKSKHATIVLKGKMYNLKFIN